MWTGFGFVALQFDGLVHRSVDAFGWLSTHPWPVGTAILGLAGTCLLHHYRRGAPAGFKLGWSHGLFGSGCCWALMLVMFAAGVGAVMAYETVGRRGETFAQRVGAAALILAGVVALHVAWLPSLFTNT